ncbi:MAG: hypothetical protein KDJ86_05315 [Bauldia sp.]|uniref:hypothetical protein n=1 Tax=Bauldia sp. TaxID=2575872 RepID=UPI001D5BB7E4|nr:hypothetical protein [Bauldia sp.]MCB1495185.1 hypothetical protein [Bauldia sp.]
MTQPGKDDNWLVRPSTIRLLWVVFIVILALTVVADFLIDHHATFGIDGTIGFYAWYGFVSCVVLVVGAKGLGVLLKRKDTYYDG